MTTFSRPGAADEEEADVSVTFNDQESDGTSVVIESLYTEVEAEVIIFHSEGDRRRYKVLNVEAETEFTDRTIELDEPIPETQLISISIQPPEGGYSYGGSRATIAVGESIDEAGPTIEFIEADSDAGFHSPYVLFKPETPDSLEKSVNNSHHRPLLVQIYPWGDFESRVENARELAEGEWIAGRMNCPLLVAPLRFRAGEKFGLQPGTEISDPRHERVDLQLLAMIEDAKSRLTDEPYTVADQIHFAGGSSAGFFIDLFAALHPEHVEVFSSGANGITFLPFAELTEDIPTYGDPEQTAVPWPIGAADFEELVDKELNRDAWINIDQFRWIGAEDQDPENPDEYVHKLYKGSSEMDNLVEGIFGSLQVDHRFETSRKIYDHLGVPATFTAFEGAGHVPESHHYSITDNYHQQKIVENFEVIHLIPQGSPGESQVGDTVTVPVLAENKTAAPSETTVTLSVDGTEVDATEIQIDPNSTETVELEATFEEPGEYVLSINDGQSESSLTVVGADSTENSDSTDGGAGQSPGDNTESTGDSGSEQEEPEVEDQPGFGISQTIAALGGIGYLINRRLSNNE